MINFLNRGRGIDTPVSERMLYEMAKRHDRWPGEEYEGSSARGAIKGWHKNGVCPLESWPYKPTTTANDYLSEERAKAALEFPLGAYYRVLKKRSDMHSALTETGAVFATAAVHDGWRKPRNGVISPSTKTLAAGGHAFCIIGYTQEGFLIQNSWGKHWGGVTIDGRKYPGCAIWLYADFDVNYWDGWVAAMALPVESLEALMGGVIATTPSGAQRVEKGPPQHEIADYYIHIDDGQFDPKGDYPSHEARTRDLINKAVNDMAGKDMKQPGHILLYAHGGLNTVKGSAARAGQWAPVFEANAIRQIHFIWETGLLASLKDILLGKDRFTKERAGGFTDWTDTLLESATQPIGYPLWKEMTGDTALAFQNAAAAGARTLKYLKQALDSLPAGRRPALHLAGHSAGSIWLGRLLDRWYGMKGHPIETLQLFAPACTMEFYRESILKHLKQTEVRSLVHYQLDKERELDDNVALIYRKSLLYLVSRSYESKAGTVPLMGMERYWNNQSHGRITTYNTRDHGNVTNSKSHGGFDNDRPTLNHLLKVILGSKPVRKFENSDLKGY
ncbi:MAG: C1 family peptidase [Candidatus Thiodiazotropha sp.]